MQQAVLDELRWEPSVAAGHIGVSAGAGVVTLTGHVGSFTQKLAAQSVKGVKAVEEITLKLPSDGRRSRRRLLIASIGTYPFLAMP